MLGSVTRRTTSIWRMVEAVLGLIVINPLATATSTNEGGMERQKQIKKRCPGPNDVNGTEHLVFIFYIRSPISNFLFNRHPCRASVRFDPFADAIRARLEHTWKRSAQRG